MSYMKNKFNLHLQHQIKINDAHLSTHTDGHTDRQTCSQIKIVETPPKVSQINFGVQTFQ